MKTRTLNLLAGLGSTLIATGSASGGFVTVQVETAPNNFGLLVHRVYALFDNPGQDHLLAVAGTADAPMLLRVSGGGGTFFQHQSGGDTAPSAALVGFFPSLAFDTFVSIGRLFDPDTTQLSKGWPGFGDSCLTGTSLGWSVSADDPQGDPVNGQVFIGQFSSADAVRFGGWILIKAISDGDPDFQANVFVCGLAPCLPGPGDVNEDLCVGIEDFLLLLSLWGSSSTCIADFDFDRVVGITDLLIVLARWGPNCP